MSTKARNLAEKTNVSPGPDRPNIILIVVDQWRGDCLSIAGHPVVKTPFLDTIALGGARFQRAYTSVPSCIAARASLLTGLSPRTHGRVGYQDGVPWNYDTTLAGEFTRHGYQTQAVGKMHVYPERNRMGFENVVLHDGYMHFSRDRKRDIRFIDDYMSWLHHELGPDADYFDHGVNCNSLVARPWDKPEYTHPTNWVVSQSIDFLYKREPTKPFFLCMSFHRPHPPYDPPAWAFEQYLGAAMPPPPVGDWTKSFERLAEPHRADCYFGDIDPVLLQRARAGYYGHMSHIDQQVNRFVEVLQEFGLDQNTWLCFTSDHGEMMGDHHFFRKIFPYEGSSRVPLILKAPKHAGVPANRTYDEVIELRDIMPTLLDCAGIPVPPSVEGKSFLPIARGEKTKWRGHLHGEHVFQGESSHFVTDGKEKYIWMSGSGLEQLFNLEKDPQECRNLASKPSSQKRLARWRKILMAELAGREEGFTDGKRLITGRPVMPCLAHIRQD